MMRASYPDGRGTLWRCLLMWYAFPDAQGALWHPWPTCETFPLVSKVSRHVKLKAWHQVRQSKVVLRRMFDRKSLSKVCGPDTIGHIRSAGLEFDLKGNEGVLILTLVKFRHKKQAVRFKSH